MSGNESDNPEGHEYGRPEYYPGSLYYPPDFPFSYGHVDLAAPLSHAVDGSDLPHDDPRTLRYFYNQGVQVRYFTDVYFTMSCNYLFMEHSDYL